MPMFTDEVREAAASMNASTDTDPDEAMEDVDDNEEEAEMEDGLEMDVIVGMSNDKDDVNYLNSHSLEGQDPFTDSTSQLNLQSHLTNRSATSLHSSTLQNSSISRQTSGTLEDLSQPGPTSHPRLDVIPPSPTAPAPVSLLGVSRPLRPMVRPEAVTAQVYDIVPTIAAPHSTSINAITATPDLRWVFSGGSDGYIRKFGWVDTANGKAMLTVAQRHPFVDSVTKAGVLLSYWENEEPQLKSPSLQPFDENLSLSPVYALAVQSQGLWLLSGLDSGGINLQSVRHDEGKRITCLRKHTSAVSVLTLPEDEKSLLSGSWDKNVYDWDLNTGQIRRGFHASGGQISAIELRPASSLSVPEVTKEPVNENGTFSSNNAEKTLANGVATEFKGEAGSSAANQETNGDNTQGARGSPTHSLFSGNDADSLFGDYDDKAGPGGMADDHFGEEDDDDEFSRAIAQGFQDQSAADDAESANANLAAQPGEAPGHENTQNGDFGDVPNNTQSTQPNLERSPVVLSNGLPRAEEVVSAPSSQRPSDSDNTQNAPPSSDSTFLAASINGILRVWDRRQPNPIASIFPRHVPPWCMGACWSPDGNFIYAGRRNGTVEEYSLHKGLRDPERTFKFPQGSGPVSAVKAMPNGRHLICASYDILRLHDLTEQNTFKHSAVPFLIIPGHRGGVISSLYIDPTCRYLISTAGNRGWEGTTTEVLLGYEIGVGWQ